MRIFESPNWNLFQLDNPRLALHFFANFNFQWKIFQTLAVSFICLNRSEFFHRAKHDNSIQICPTITVIINCIGLNKVLFRFFRIPHFTSHCLDLDLYAHDRSHFHRWWFLVELEWDNWFLLEKGNFCHSFF